MTTNFALPNKNHKQKTAYINANIIDPATRHQFKGSLITEGNKIVDFGESIFTPGENNDFQVIDCKNHLLAPGLLDIQVHFREPGQLHKESISSGSKSAVAGGITGVVCQPNTKPVIDCVEILEQIKQRAHETSFCDLYVYPAISMGMKGEELSDMKAMVEAGAVGFTDDGLPVMNAQLMRKAFEATRDLNVPIVQHAEDLNLSQKGPINEGFVSRKLNIPGIPNISESVIVERDLAILEYTGGKYHVLHVSTKEALDAIRRAKDKGLNVTCEAAPHHFILTDEAILEHGTNAKMNPPLRSAADRDALIEGLIDGTIDAIATDHAPHDLESKNQPLEKATFGIVGVETMLPLSLELYYQGKMSLMDVMAAMTYKPSDILNLGVGRIKKGAIANLTLIDLNDEYIIEPEKFYSLSKNTPFGGRKVKGRAIRTIIHGQTVYEY